MTQLKSNGASGEPLSTRRSLPHLLTRNAWSAYSQSHRKFFEDGGIWKEAPLLTGSTKYEPLDDVKNIMITGGAGFM